jgi:hypothetical protein
MSECVIGYETVDGSFVGVTCAGEGYILDAGPILVGMSWAEVQDMVNDGLMNGGLMAPGDSDMYDYGEKVDPITQFPGLDRPETDHMSYSYMKLLSGKVRCFSSGGARVGEYILDEDTDYDEIEGLEAGDEG